MRSTAEIEEIMARYSRGDPTHIIARDLGFTYETVRGFLRRGGVPPKIPPFRDPKIIEAVGQAYAADRTSKSTAREVGISVKTVLKIVNEYFPQYARTPAQAVHYAKKTSGVAPKRPPQLLKVKDGCAECGLPIVSRTQAQGQLCPDCKYFSKQKASAEPLGEGPGDEHCGEQGMEAERMAAEKNAEKIREYYARHGEDVVVEVKRVKLGSYDSNSSQYTYSAVIV